MGRKKGEDTRSVTIRMPVRLFDLVTRYAAATDVDVSTVLNGLVGEGAREMERWLEEQEGAGPAARHLAGLERIGPAAYVAAVREVYESLPAFTGPPLEDAPSLRKRAEAHRQKAIAIARKVAGRAGASLDAGQVAAEALAVQGLAIAESSFAIGRPTNTPTHISYPKRS